MRNVLGALAIVCLTLVGCATERTLSDGFPLAEMRQSSVLIQGRDGHGSGTLIGGRYVLTAAHVIKETGPFFAVWENGRTIGVTIKEVWSGLDIAVLELDQTPDATPAPLACGGTKFGQNVAAIGNPLNVKAAVLVGVVASEVTVSPTGAIALNLPALPGMSGGGVFNLNGEVVGVTDAMIMVPIDNGFYLLPMGKHVDAVTISPSGISIMIPTSILCEKLHPYISGPDNA